MYSKRLKTISLANVMLVFLLIPIHFSQAAATTVDSKKATHITSPQGLKGLKPWQIWKDPNSNRLYRVLAGTSRQAQIIKAELEKTAKQSASTGTLSPMTINDNIGTYIPNAQELSKLKSWQIWKDPNNNRLYHLKAKTAQEAQKVKNNLEAGAQTTQNISHITPSPTAPISSNPSPQPSTAPVQAPSISFTSPRGGEQWLIGTTHTINWTISPPLATNQSISIGLVKDAVPTAGLNAILSSQISSSSWAIPATLKPGNGYGIQILIIDQSSGGVIFNSGSNVFSIATTATPIAKVTPESKPVSTVKPTPVPTPTAKPSIKPYKLGLVYIYDGPDTYNPEWRTKIEPIRGKTVTALRNLLGTKIDPSLDILGEVKTSVFEWNPAKIGITWKTDITTFYESLPGSSFLQTSFKLPTDQTMVAVDCPTATKCGIEAEGDYTIVRINSNKAPDYKNLWQSNKLSLLNQEISQKLNINFSDYSGVVIVFGRLGRPLDTDPKYLQWYCSGARSQLDGYSNLIMSENSLIEPTNYLIDCGTAKKGMSVYYQKVGWHTLVHEILHRFGTVDIYETGFVFGIKSEREKALAVDPLADQSIMGNDKQPCNGKICTQAELERVYLDKYNRQIMGLE